MDNKTPENKTPEKIQLLLKQVADHFDIEDRYVRERQIRQWKRLKYYWAGFQRLWWSETAHDWRVHDLSEISQTADSSFYDKPINIFRAYLESIIAALSITVPSVKCFPDDAENDLDLATAKAGDKIADLISKHNDVTLLWLHALFIYCTEGMVACHNYTKEDYEFGEYATEKKEDTEEEVEVNICPNCGAEIPQETANLLMSQFDPEDEDVAIDDLLKSNNFCVQCQAEVMPTLEKKKIIVTRLVGLTTKPKSRQCLEVYGGLYVKVPNYALKQKDCPYLKFSYETHYANAIERFPHLRDKFTGQSKIGPGSGGMYDPYERWGRISTQYFGEYPINTVTISSYWLRPASFNVINEEEDVKELKKLYPDGAKVVFVNDDFAEAENENLDDNWTLTYNPLSDYIHFDPLGLLLTSVQEITNDLTSLILQTIEHGIPQTFASPDTLNFEAYRNTEIAPGSIVPTKPQGSKNIGESFYTVKTAALSSEVLPFADRMQEAGQLVSGALPSLFGGSQASGSKTAAQYSMSRAQAQQRLSSTWKMFNVWWKTIYGKVIPSFIKELKDDERFVQKDESGNFFNVYIKTAETQGKIGSIELESTEELPATWGQKKDVIMQLLQSTNPDIMAALTSPKNRQLLAQAIGLSDFNIPGEDDRAKQFEEIRLLLQSEPIPTIDPITGQQIEGPSVDVEQVVDNHAIEAEICRGFLVSSAGRLAKTENPSGYRNILLHLQKHVEYQQPPMPEGNQPQQPLAAKLPQGGSNVPLSP